MERLVITSLMLCLSFSAFGQSLDTLIEQFMQDRRRLIEKFEDSFESDSFFSDSLFDGIPRSSVIHINQVEKDDGSIDIVIDNEKNQNLDIETLDDRIVIKMSSRVEEENTSEEMSSKSYSSTMFSRHIGIPEGYKASTPRSEGKQIIITLNPIDKKLNTKPSTNKKNRGLSPFYKEAQGDVI